MTPKEKAGELFDKYFNPLRKLTTDTHYQTYLLKQELCIQHAKQCALIAVDEILNSFPHTFGINKEYTKSGELVTSMVNIRPNISYWQEVKQEIENL